MSGGEQLRPTELFSRPTLMAIRTTHVALPDFGEELIASPSCTKKSDVLEFVHAVSVVEFEYKRVTLTTIHTTMRAQIFVNLAA